MQKEFIDDSVERFLEIYFKVSSMPVPEWVSRGKADV